VDLRVPLVPAAGRLLVLVGLVASLLAVQATAAEAHTRTQETTNVVSRILDDPGLPGVEWTVHTGGLLLEVEHRGEGVLVVAGYEGEPYLRIGPEGVERNRNSPATYLGEDRYGEIAVPPRADADAAPDWRRISDRPHHTWHDHRVHWMSPSPPPFVEAGPLARGLMALDLVGHLGHAEAEEGVIQRWEVPLTYGGEPATLTGELLWHDPPSPLPWLLAGALLVTPGLAGLRRRDRAGLARPAALVVGAVAAVNAVHLVDDLIAWPSHPLDDLFGLLHTGLFLTTGLVGALWAWRVEAGRLLALGIAGAAVLYHQGLVHGPMLLASGFPTVWPDPLLRLTVALAFAQAVVVTVVLATARRREGPGSRTGQPSPTSSVASRPRLAVTGDRAEDRAGGRGRARPTGAPG
jgi:hypothetical protein